MVPWTKNLLRGKLLHAGLQFVGWDTGFVHPLIEKPVEPAIVFEVAGASHVLFRVANEVFR